MPIIDVKIPSIAESITEVRIANWLVTNGETVKIDQALCELETDKATQELYAEAAGTVVLIAKEGDDVLVGAMICTIDTSGAAAPSIQAAAPAQPASSPTPAHTKTPATPVATNILADKGIPPTQVQGTGENGKITKADALQATHHAPIKTDAPAQSAEIINKPPTTARTATPEKMTKLRQTIAKRLVTVKNETAMLTTFNEVDMKPIMDLRNQYKEKFEKKHEVGLGFMSFFVKAACLALQEFTAVNAYNDGDQMIYHNYCDVSIAVSTPKGLMVPVLRNAELLSLSNIEKNIKTLAIKARDGKLSIDDMQGGTFSITNGGVFGSMLSTPILNPPQSAILGMHNIVERAVVQNGAIVIRPIMYLALSYDHRIIDGKQSVGFLVRIKEYLEDPARMLLMV